MNAVAIVGPNGIGKSTFIKSIVDQIPLSKVKSALVPMLRWVTMTKPKVS